MAASDPLHDGVLIAVAPEQQITIGRRESFEPWIRARRPFIDWLRELQELPQLCERRHRMCFVAAIKPDQRALLDRQLRLLGVRPQREITRDDDQTRRSALQPSVLGERRGKPRECIPARRARRDQDGEPALVDGARDRIELQLPEAVGACPVLPIDEAEFVHHPAVHPLVIGGRIANVQERPVRSPGESSLAR